MPTSTTMLPFRNAHPEGSGPLLREILGRIGDKWSVIVICQLDGGPARFNQLKRAVDGITQRMLSATLRHLERDGLVTRTVYPTVPPAVEYELTASGHNLHEILYALVGWTDNNADGVQIARAEYDRRQ
ncbi:transcriptional regulator [Subtercola boreus]|uniref:Transcriptional regulator n=1 Tax=Subtercola boreus TaxID=120213 RepID=A0A3E0VUD3_9MICO|nr:helix-turn-helix domain-containing protein [Subtercola boreus]RFA13119.1 transcriptional regulator [Subtercola boreus]